MSKQAANNKNRKLGRNQSACTRYKADNRQQTNRRRRMLRTLAKYPDNYKLAQRLMTEGVPKQTVQSIIVAAQAKATMKINRSLHTMTYNTSPHADQCRKAEWERRRQEQEQVTAAQNAVQFANAIHTVLGRELVSAQRACRA